jgi:hypothetical protein
VVGGLNNGILLGMETTAELVSLPGRDAFLLTEASDI